MEMLSFLPLKNNSLTIGLDFLLDSISAISRDIWIHLGQFESKFPNF